MPHITRILIALAGLSLYVAGSASGLGAKTSGGFASIPHSPGSGTCFSSPLLGALQCTETPNNTTSHAPTEDAAEEDSSGGWSGPHACAGAYCVYTHPTFATNRGIALIADGDSANTLANLPIFTHLTSEPHASADATLNTKSSGIATHHIPNKGRGFVATRPLTRGEPLLAYTPALVIARAFVDDLSKAEQLRLLRDAVHRLPQQTKDAFWTQLGQTHAPDDTDILAIVENNSFNLPLNLPGGGGGGFIGNFPEVSMYNHDCRPNAAFHLDHGLVHRTMVVSGVGSGQELSISYVDSYRIREVRRGRTMRNWGFACGCELCSLPAALGNASDHRLWRIYEVETGLALREEKKEEEKGTGKTQGEVEDEVELLLSLYAQERLLDSHGAVAYKTAALNYNALGRAALAVKYALLALEARIVEDGAGSVGARDMVALLDGPEGHWSWRRRL